LSEEQQFRKMVARHAKDESSSGPEDSRNLRQDGVDLGNVLQNGVADDRGNASVGNRKGISKGLGQDTVRTPLLCFAEDTTGRVYANRDATWEGNRSKMTIATAYIEDWLFQGQEILIQSGLNSP